MPKKDEIAKLLEAASASNPEVEFHLFTQQELDARTQNHEADVIARKTGEIYQNLENDVLTVTGVAKNQGEKAYNYLKRVLTDLKANANNADASELQKKLQALEEEKAKGFPNLKKELDDLRDLATRREQELQAKLSEKDKLLRNKDVEGQITLATMGLKFNSTMPKAVIDTFINNIRKEIVEATEIEDGVIKIKDKDGKILRNPSTLEPLTIAEVMVDRLSPIIEQGRKQEGGGSEDDGAKKKDSEGVLVPPAEALRSKETLSDWLRKAGIPQGSKEFNDVWGKYAIKLPRS